MRLKPARVALFIGPLLVAAALAWLTLPGSAPARPDRRGEWKAGMLGGLARDWAEFSGQRPGKVVFARPPRMYILDLRSGSEKEVPGVQTDGGPGRSKRGATPRPSWAPDGHGFAYRFQGRIYVCDPEGRKRPILNPRMDSSDETRWTWQRRDNSDWLAGPALDGSVILVSVTDPAVARTAFSGGNVRKHCEITGSGRYVVYDDGAHVRVAPFAGHGRGLRISQGQSCRPCAAADDRVAWLPAPHDRYRIFRAADGRFVGDLLAPPAEEIYRLNWSNLPDFAVHMYGADGNSRMHVRKISNGARLFIGSGWDPDLWIGP